MVVIKMIKFLIHDILFSAQKQIMEGWGLAFPLAAKKMKKEKGKEKWKQRKEKTNYKKRKKEQKRLKRIQSIYFAGAGWRL